MTLLTTDLPAGDAGRIELRPATDTDRPFLRMQFDAQDSWYRQIYPDGQFLVVVHEGKPVGRLYIGRSESEIRIIDIALLPEHRCKGIGSRLLADIFASADESGLPVALRVEPWNPAKRLYGRLGFELRGQDGLYETMVRPPQLNTAS